MSLVNKHGVSRAVIVPAAGFGQRVGSPESKEMLLRAALLVKNFYNHAGGESDSDVVDETAPLIDWPLKLAAAADAKAVVVTRSEKKNLIMHLESWRIKGAAVEICSVQSTREWPESILAAREHWGELNVVCLPDVEFAPRHILNQMFLSLQKHDLVFATFNPSDGFSKWGVVDTHFMRHCEKPIDVGVQSNLRAWGLFGFRKAHGEYLLNNMLSSTFKHDWHKLEGFVDFVELDNFKDLTR